MTNLKNRFRFLETSVLQITGLFLMFLVAILLLWKGNADSNQAISALLAQVYFEGEYRVGEGEWQEIIEGQHIPATKGDVILRGNFHMLTPDGEYVGPLEPNIPIALFMDHINVTIYEDGTEPFVVDDENPMFGSPLCGEAWSAYSSVSDGTKPIEIVIHNPHRFGNETAIDEFLSNVAIWGNIEFERDILSRGQTQRNTGLLFFIVSFVLLGTALFSMLIHIKTSKIIWLLD